MNPFLGVFFHWLGGLASGSFYVPYKGVRKWAWEVYWLVGGFFSWIIMPILLASLLTNDVFGVIRQQTAATLWWTYFFGAMWGFGGLTFGLTMRYLGMSLGMGVALGYCAAFGTLLPPIFKSFIPSIPVPETLGEIASTLPGQITLLGVLVCLVGIAVAAYAGLTKEREMPAAEKKKAIAEFNYGKGIMVATFSGIMSACFSFALTAGNPIGEAAADAGTKALWTGLPKLVVVLAGGFTTNFIWCVLLNFRNRTGYQYFSRTLIVPAAKPGDAVSGADLDLAPTGGTASRDNRVPMARNYFFSALAGTTWYMQFFFYTMGETQMGKFGFASWTLHMASIIIFSTMWGWIFHEWKGASKKSHGLIAGGIALLILSTVVIGLGTYLKGQATATDTSDSTAVLMPSEHATSRFLGTRSTNVSAERGGSARLPDVLEGDEMEDDLPPGETVFQSPPMPIVENGVTNRYIFPRRKAQLKSLIEARRKNAASGTMQDIAGLVIILGVSPHY